MLDIIEGWVQAGAGGTSVFWLHGPAGAGIAQTVAEICAGRNQLAASFFFARTAAHRNESKYLFPTIAIQLALSAPQKRQRLDEILNNDPFIAERDLGSVNLLPSLFDDYCDPTPVPRASSFLVIVDGLDECQRKDDQRRILAQVSRMVHTHHHLTQEMTGVLEGSATVVHLGEDSGISIM